MIRQWGKTNSLLELSRAYYIYVLREFKYLECESYTCSSTVFRIKMSRFESYVHVLVEVDESRKAYISTKFIGKEFYKINLHEFMKKA